jgi:hypothetical protein
LLHVVDERVIPDDGRGNLVVTEARAILSDGQQGASAAGPARLSRQAITAPLSAD